MTTAKQLGIWMDHSSAHLMEFTTEPIEANIITSKFTHQEKEHSLDKGEHLMHNKEQHQQSDYYKKLGEVIKNYEDVILFGPTDAKVELLNLGIPGMKSSSAKQDHLPIIKELTAFLNGGNAHASFEDAIAGTTEKLLGEKPKGLPYSIWQLAEHIRITQWDILEFSRNPAHKSPKWPDEYWPKEAAPADSHAWQASIKQVGEDREAFIALLKEKQDELHIPFAHGEGQTLFREALLIADHTSYHTGEIIVIRRLLKDWK
jgi:hypothetical protein